jgi:hypothetical protein
MFWVSVQRSLFSDPYNPRTARPHLTAGRTDRVIRLPSPLGRASDHRLRQAESEFGADHHSRINLQRRKRSRVHIRVSFTTDLPFFHTFSLILVKRQQGPGRKGKICHRYGVECGTRGYRGSAAYGSGQEQRRKGFRVSIAVIARCQFTAYQMSLTSFEKADIFVFFVSARRSITCLLVTTDQEDRSIIA